MATHVISYDHPNRLRAIIDTYYNFFEKEAGFIEVKSQYNPERLTGNLLLQLSDIEILFSIHNDDVDIYIKPVGMQTERIPVTDLLFYFEQPKLDYNSIQKHSTNIKFTDDEIWRNEATNIKKHLKNIIAFAQPKGYEERIANLKQYQAKQTPSY